MKILDMKLPALFAAGLLALAPAAADTSGLRKGTASTVEDDAYYFMNVLDWAKLDAPSAYAITGISSTNSLNLGVAVQDLLGGTVHAAWSGNLWSYDEDNEFRALYGRNNLGFLVDFHSLHESTKSIQSVSLSDYSEWSALFKLGMNVSDLFSFVAGIGFGNGSGTVSGADVSRLSLPDLTFTAYRVLLRTDRLTGTLFIPVEFSYASTSYKDNDDSAYKEVLFSFGAGFKMQYQITDTLTYGLFATTPIAIENAGASGSTVTTTKWLPVLRNGLSAELLPGRLALNMGIATKLPEVQFSDGDTSKSTLANTFYGGASLYITPAVRLDACGEVYPADGVSLDELWNQNFTLTLSAKF